MQEYRVSSDGTFKTKIKTVDGVPYIVISNFKKKVECPLDEFNCILEVFNLPKIKGDFKNAHYSEPN